MHKNKEENKSTLATHENPYDMRHSLRNDQRSKHNRDKEFMQEDSKVYDVTCLSQERAQPTRRSSQLRRGANMSVRRGVSRRSRSQPARALLSLRGLSLSLIFLLFTYGRWVKTETLESIFQ